ncbi:MAG: DNA-processing protein DprA [Burkholderiaceae bacterium]
MTPLPNPNNCSPNTGPKPPPECTTPPDELRAWLRLNITHGIGPATALILLRVFGTPHGIFSASHRAVSDVVGAALATRLLAPDDETDHAVARSLAWAALPDHHLLTLADPAYPPALMEIGDPPPLLYVKGNLASLSAPGIGIVGSRHATRTGLDNAAAFAAELSARGLTVFSGLAHGIDTAAHRGTLDANGLTVAVMGTGIDRIYPAANKNLAASITGINAGGAIITEMPIGSAALRANFPRRNRLIAGLSAGVLVIEAARHSGSLITARQASEFGREVFAVPGSIHSPVSRGCHQLIRQGAKLVECAQDVFDELCPILNLDPAPPHSELRAASRSDSAKHHPILQQIGWDTVSMDALLSDSAQPADAAGLAQGLLELELTGLIERLPDGRIRRRPQRGST